MSEVKRYLADEQYPGQYSARCDLVPASAYDAAQSQLAALREELDAHLKIRDRELEIAAEHADDLQQRLADAERRNDEIMAVLATAYATIPHLDARARDSARELVRTIGAALNPSHDESGASE